jgi:anaerobic selenocysteine-containing dehydrogenase
VIISEGLYDKEFVKDWTLGFDKFAEYVKEFTPKRVEEITRVPAATVEKIARLYATTKPACTSLGVSMDHCTNGIQAIRAISVMVAITGNLDVPGGSVIDPGGLAQTNLRLEDRVAGETPIGADYPIYTKYIRETVLTHLIDAILDGKPYPVKGLLVAGSNLAVTWPDSSRVRKALEKLDLLAVIDIFMNDTAKIADIVLPATTFGEREDIRDAYHNHEDLCVFVRTNRVIEPIGNSMEDWKIWAELGRRMGYAEYFPWKDTEELHRELLKPSGITLEQLKQNPGGIIYREKKFQQYLKDGFNTPSKKVEIYSEAMDKLGIDPIPTFREPLESPISRPDLAKKYPLTLTTGSRLAPYLHSEYRNLPSLKKLLPEPFIEINPETASKLGIANGDMVKVESPRGSIKIKAKLTDDVHSNVVSIQMGWAEANANFLTSNTTSDPVLGIAGLRSVLCRVIKAK